MVLRHDDLRGAMGEVRGKKVVLGRAGFRIREAQDQRRADVVKPDLGRIDPVPVTGFSGPQQEIDAGAMGAARVFRDPGLAIVTALGVGREIEAADDLIGGRRASS